MIRYITRPLHAYYNRTLAGPIEIFARYWKAYGRSKALFTSAYFHLAVILLLITSHYWLFEKWWEQPITVIPNLLGFSLGGFAVFVGLSDDGFRAWLSTSKNEQQPSAFLSVSSTFVHFIVVQAASLLLAILGKSLDFKYDWPDALVVLIRLGTLFFSGFGYLVFLYAITSMLAATMSLFRVVSWYQSYHASQGRHDDT
jgi:hypothetical protein